MVPKKIAFVVNFHHKTRVSSVSSEIGIMSADGIVAAAPSEVVARAADVNTQWECSP